MNTAALHPLLWIYFGIIFSHYIGINLNPDIPLLEFVTYVRNTIEPDLWRTPEKFQELNEYLWPQAWLTRYADKTYIAHQTLKGMAKKTAFKCACGLLYCTRETHYKRVK